MRVEAVQPGRIVDQNAMARRGVVGPFEQQIEQRGGVRKCIATGVRPVARPHAPFRRGGDKSVSERGDVLVMRWTSLRGLVRRRQLDPGVAGVEESQQGLKSRMIGRDRLQELAVMVDDQRNRQSRKYVFISCEVAAIELHLNV